MTSEVKPIRHIVFDFGGVLLTVLDKEMYDNERIKVATQLGLNPPGAEEAKAAFYESEEWLEAKVGKISSDEFFGRVCARGGVTDPAVLEDIRYRMRESGRGVDPRMRSLILDLRQMMAPTTTSTTTDAAAAPPLLRSIAILSNFESDFDVVMKNQRLIDPSEPSSTTENMDPLVGPKSPLFCPVLFSAQIRLAKPSLDCFRLLLHALGDADPQEVLFIDDKESNTKAAAQLGINTIVYTEFEEVEKQIRDRLRMPPPPRATTQS